MAKRRAEPTELLEGLDFIATKNANALANDLPNVCTAREVIKREREKMAGNHSKAFEFFGVVPKNIRWSWSGRSPDGSIVAVRLWQDRFDPGAKSYRSWTTDVPGEWRSRPGFVELIDNLKHARDHLDGVVSVILLIAKDKDASPRSIERSSPAPNLKMRVIELDEEQGTFLLARVGG